MNPSWVPVWQHVIVALILVLCLAMAGVPPLASALINMMVWTLREAWQRWWREKSLNPHDWSTRTHYEWILASSYGAAMAWVAPAIIERMGVYHAKIF
jgi:hypothetical protein